MVWGYSVGRGTSLNGSIFFDSQTSVFSSSADSLDDRKCMVSVKYTSDVVTIEVSIVAAYYSRIQFNMLIVSTH